MLVYVLFCYSSFVVNRVDHFRGGKSPVGGGESPVTGAGVAAAAADARVHGR